MEFTFQYYIQTVSALLLMTEIIVRLENKTEKRKVDFILRILPLTFPVRNLSAEKKYFKSYKNVIMRYFHQRIIYFLGHAAELEITVDNQRMFLISDVD